MAEVYPAPSAPSPAPKKRSRLLIGCAGAVALLVVCSVLGSLFNRGGVTTATQPTAAPAAVADVPTTAPAAAPTEAPAPTEAAAEPTQAAVVTAAPATGGDVLEVGQTGDLGDMKVTLNEVKVVEGSEFMKPDEGKQFIVVDVTFENTGTKDENISSMLQMEMRDETGQAYGVDLGATTASGGKSPEGVVPPGDKLRGQVGYQVPVDATGLRWLFKNAFGSGRVTFNAQP